MQTYITEAKNILSKYTDVEDELLDLYTLLVLTKGADTTMEDIHDAWSLWRQRSNPGHPSLVPFSELSKEVQEYDRKYMEAVHKAAYMLLRRNNQNPMKTIYDKSVAGLMTTAIHADDCNALKPITPTKCTCGVVDDLSELLKHNTLALIDAEIERVEGMKKSQKECSCGGALRKATGTGMVVFPLQCIKCGSYTDYTHNGYNQALTDHLTYLKEQRKLIKNEV